jgi:hypothetical protein
MPPALATAGVPYGNRGIAVRIMDDRDGRTNYHDVNTGLVEIVDAATRE